MSNPVTLTDDEHERYVCCVKSGKCRDDHFHRRDIESIVAARCAEALREVNRRISESSGLTSWIPQTVLADRAAWCSLLESLANEYDQNTGDKP